MKKKTILLSICIILFSVICFLLISNSTKEKPTIDELIKNADYSVLASRNGLKCKDEGSHTIMSAYRGEKPYIKDGKVYTEIYLTCQCTDYLGEKIIVVTSGYYLKEDELYFLFLKSIDEKNKLFTPIDNKTGIINCRDGKLYPMDLSLKEDLDNKYSDASELFDFFIDICKENAPNTTEKEVSISTTIPQTTAAS